MHHIMAALAQRLGQAPGTAFIQKEAHAYSAAKVALPRRTSAA
jgi:hypothetical protein